MEASPFTLDRPYDQSELAALFGEFAAALEDDRPATIDVGGGTAEITFPSPVSVRLTSVHEEAPPTEGIELALEWDAAGTRRVRFASADDEPAPVAEIEPAPTADEEEAGSTPPEPASSVMPSDAFASTSGPTGPDDEVDADEPSTDGRRSRFEVYRDRAGEWRWRLVHWNGNIIADSGEGYASRYNATRAARGVMRATADAQIDQLES